MAQKNKQLVLLGNSISSATEAYFSEANGFLRIPASIDRFPSGEPYIELFHKQENKAAENALLIEGQNILAVQSSGENYAGNILNLQMMIYTLKRYGAASVTAYVQMMPLLREDRKFENRFVFEGTRFLAETLKNLGLDKIITITPHSQANLKDFWEFFGESFIALDTASLFAADIKARHKLDALVIGAPDGAEKKEDESQKRAEKLSEAVFGKSAGHQRFMIRKEHISGTTNETRIVGHNKDMPGKVGGKDCIIIDDMIDGGSTMVNAAALLKKSGARSVTCYATHGILSNNAFEKMLTRPTVAEAPIDRIVLTDTLPDVGQKISAFLRKYPSVGGRIDQLASASLLSDALGRFSA